MMLLKYISEIGKREHYDNATNTAIAFTNWITVIIIFSSLGCTLLSYSLSDELVVLSWLFTFINASSLPLTAVGLFTLARYVLNLGPSLYLALLHIAIKQPGQEMITAVLLIQIGVLSVPWIMFKTGEKIQLYTINFINILFIFLSVYLPGQNHNLFDNSIYVTGMGVDFGLSICTLGSLLIISFVNWTHHKGQQDIRSLLHEMEEKSQTMVKDQLQLKEYILKVEEAQEIEKKRQWITNGLAEVTEILRNQRNAANCQDILISTIVKSLGANQGAFYIAEENPDGNISLVLKACYAYKRKKHLEKRIPSGEGLVGQCFLEKEMLYLTDIPQGYTHITSGLGQATPTNLILIPLLSDQRVEGILEVASFSIMAEHQIKYLESIGTILGSYLYSENMLKQHLSSLKHNPVFEE